MMKMLRNRNLYYIGKKLRLKKKDIDLVLNDTYRAEEQPSFSAGPPWYLGTHYGTVSINEF